MKIKFIWDENGEDCLILCNDSSVIDMGHGPHGWDGMRGIMDAVLAIASITGASVEHVGEPCI